jgi:hypothetical protein
LRGAAQSGRWPESLGIFRELLQTPLPTNLIASRPLPTADAIEKEGDISNFFWTATAFYLSILAVTLGWWTLRAMRKRRERIRGASILAWFLRQ